MIAVLLDVRLLRDASDDRLTGESELSQRRFRQSILLHGGS